MGVVFSNLGLATYSRGWGWGRWIPVCPGRLLEPTVTSPASGWRSSFSETAEVWISALKPRTAVAPDPRGDPVAKSFPPTRSMCPCCRCPPWVLALSPRLYVEAPWGVHKCHHDLSLEGLRHRRLMTDLKQPLGKIIHWGLPPGRMQKVQGRCNPHPGWSCIETHRSGSLGSKLASFALAIRGEKCFNGSRRNMVLSFCSNLLQFDLRIDFSFSDPWEVLLWGWPGYRLWTPEPSGGDGEQGDWDSHESLFVYSAERGSVRGRLRGAWSGRHTVVTATGLSLCSCEQILKASGPWSSSSPADARGLMVAEGVSSSPSVPWQPFWASFSSFSACLKPFRVNGCVAHRASGRVVGLGETRPFSLGLAGGWSSINDSVSCWHTATCLWWQGKGRRRSSGDSLRAGESPELGIHMLALSPRQRRWGWKSGNGENP